MIGGYTILHEQNDPLDLLLVKRKAKQSKKKRRYAAGDDDDEEEGKKYSDDDDMNDSTLEFYPEYHLNPTIEKGKGMGLQLMKPARKGTVIGYYFGDVQRERPDKTEANYTFDIVNKQTKETIYIIAKRNASLAVFINNSLFPNCEATDCIYRGRYAIRITLIKDVPGKETDALRSFLSLEDRGRTINLKNFEIQAKLHQHARVKSMRSAGLSDNHKYKCAARNCFDLEHEHQDTGNLCYECTLKHGQQISFCCKYCWDYHIVLHARGEESELITKKSPNSKWHELEIKRKEKEIPEA